MLKEMLDHSLQSALDSLLAAYRSGTPSAARFAPGAEVVDSCVDSALPAHLPGLLRAKLPGLRVELKRTYGEGPELGALLQFSSGERAVEAAWGLRIDGQGRLERFLSLWDPAELLGHGKGGQDPAVKAAVVAYFRTYNDNEEDTHIELLSPKMVYFGSVSRMTGEGRPTGRGVFRGARDHMGLKRLEPLRVFGAGPDLAVRVRVTGASGRLEEALWLLRLDSQGLFDRVSVLWNPSASFLRRPETN